jgi:hypothetical protein
MNLPRTLSRTVTSVWFVDNNGCPTRFTTGIGPSDVVDDVMLAILAEASASGEQLQPIATRKAA